MPLLTEPAPYEEAARIVAEKQIMSKEAFDALCDELKARAFVVTGLEDLRAVQEIRDAIAELPRGAAWEDVKAQVVEKLEEGGFSQAAADYRATLLLRHHGFAAYAQENYRELREMQDVFPYWKYQSMGDEKVRSSHAALDGLILPADDPFWKDHFPPWEWNCRCMVVGVTEEEYGSAKTVGSFDATDPDAKAAGWKLTPALRERLRQGQLDDGSGHPVMVTRTGSLHFDPSGPGLDLAEIQKRYDPADWARFKTAMKAEKLADGRSVWDWVNGQKVAESARRNAPAFGNAQSAKDAARESRAFASEAKWRDIPADIINTTNRELSRISSTYGLQRLDRIGAYTKNRGKGKYELAHANGTILEVNRDGGSNGIFILPRARPYCAPAAKAPGQFWRNNVGVTNSGLPVASVIRHEVGHVLWYQRLETVRRTKGAQAHRDILDETQALYDKYKRIRREKVRIAKKPQAKWTDAERKTMGEWDISQLSEYGEKNMKEFFSEAFCAFDSGETLPADLTALVFKVAHGKL